MNFTISVQTACQTEFKEVTRELQQLVADADISEGSLLLYVPHTTAAITINENADPDVVTDMINGLNKLIPLKDNYRHLEGNSAAHIKSSLIGPSEQIIIHQGKLLLGTWQGIYFCEFDGPRSRKLHIKLTKD
ncbi:MAG: secondary thiamine-phosphate synthase enzyme YjbQ [Deltaproteobacteria bacterium]|nr:secondary thiamine-phosphate synthase enzyme YjbQ [Deltaproteobacteria bacterium]MCW8892525.1 secondary thiamine-phosphate synthase enzyme YjbQ [Deltaproteobacteria bacterium]MCW9050602.1 secondary thiamine-phosphate synthase enzyme YjbQ [Deltaproteobacteria bacterium]